VDVGSAGHRAVFAPMTNGNNAGLAAPRYPTLCMNRTMLSDLGHLPSPRICQESTWLNGTCDLKDKSGLSRAAPADAERRAVRSSFALI
jgi:hypothetical protein